MEQVRKDYFACWYRLQLSDRYLIWISLGDYESVFVDEQGCIPVFNSEMALAAFAKAKGIEIVNEEPLLIDLDAVAQWLQQPQSSIDCVVCLGAWNLFTDVAQALQITFIGDKQGPLRNRIYDKLYFGNNIFIGDPTLGHPSGKFYIPHWSLTERTKIARVLSQGLAMFKSKLLEVQT